MKEEWKESCTHPALLATLQEDECLYIHGGEANAVHVEQSQAEVSGTS